MKKRGRKKMGNVAMTVYVTPEQIEWLDTLAESRGWDRSQTMREILKDEMGVNRGA